MGPRDAGRFPGGGRVGQGGGQHWACNAQSGRGQGAYQNKPVFKHGCNLHGVG
jgi:hypothetical protein